MEEIRNTIEYNVFFKWAFGEDIQKGNKWDQFQMTVKRDRDYGINTQASITAYTLRGGLASAHHPNIILDDPLNEQTAFSESERERAIELYVHLESIISKYSESMFTLVGTPWPGYDVIQHAMEFEVAHGERLYWGIGARGGFECTPSLLQSHPEIIPSVDDRIERDGVIFSEVCPAKKLDKIKRQDLNSYIYQYLCTRPEDGDNGFDTTLIRDFSLLEDGTITCSCDLHKDHDHHINKLVVVGICDPALSTSGSACESAIEIVGKDVRCNCRFLLDEWGGHVHNDALVRQICTMAFKWETYMKRFAIEDVHFQTFIKSWLLELQSRGEFPLGMELFGVKPKKRDKDLRIAGQQTYVQNGYWHKRPYMQFDEGTNNTIWQIHKWPNQPKKRDRADAWAYCDDVWADLASPRMSKERMAENPIRHRNSRTMRKQLIAMEKAQRA